MDELSELFNIETNEFTKKAKVCYFELQNEISIVILFS